MSSQHRLKVLANEWHNCTRCGLHETRIGPNIFFGYGPSNPKYLVIGAGPSESDENYKGIFSGDEGDILFELMRNAKIDLTECFFTYVVSCRPKVFIPATDTEEERTETRTPTKDEVVSCRPRLYEILYQTDPRMIITVGEIATKAMVRGRMRKFIEVVGQQFVCTLPAATSEDREEGKVTGKSRYHDLTYPLYPIHEMSTIVNNPSTAKHGPYTVTLSTLKKAYNNVEFVVASEAATMEGST